MEYIRGKLKKDILVSKGTHLMGELEGNVVIAEGINLQLHGKITGNVSIKTKAELVVHGTILGDIANQGGNLRIYGKVAGKISSDGGTTYIDPGAEVE